MKIKYIETPKKDMCGNDTESMIRDMAGFEACCKDSMHRVRVMNVTNDGVERIEPSVTGYGGSVINFCPSCGAKTELKKVTLQ